MAIKTFNVSNAAQLTAALAKASGGDTIVMAGGNYGDVNLSGLKFASNVTLTSATETHPAVFDSISVFRSTNLTIDNVSVDFTPTTATNAWDAAIDISASSNITISNSHVEGGPSPVDGLLIGRGISADNCKNITVSGTEVTEFRRGVCLGNTDGVNILDNNIHHNRTSTLSGGNLNNVLIEGNTLASSHPNNFGGDGDHGDFIHFWTSPTQAGANHDYIIRGNYLNQGDGTALLGIYLDDNVNKKGFSNVLIEDNVIYNGNAQGVRAEDVDGLTVRNNTMIQSAGSDPRDAPGVLLCDGTKNVVVTGNILGSVSGPATDNMTGNNIAIGDNYVVQTTNPNAENYVGNLFTNPFATNPEIEDLRALPGTSANNYGADMTHIVADGGPFDGIISDSHGTGLDLSSHDFGVLDGSNANGNKLPARATVVWDFGDGTHGRGALVTHTYGSAGTYTATATVTLITGETYVVDRSVSVRTPIAVETTFENGLKDNTDVANLVTALGKYHMVTDDFRKSVHLDKPNSAIKFEANSEIVDNDDFTISLGFKKDAGYAAAGGRVLYFSGTAVIDVSANGITLRGSTDAGETITLRSKGDIGIQDNDWHQITYTASKTDGTAILYVDGTEVARMEGLTGGQYTTGGHSLYLGNPYGANMAGLLDNLSFIQAALTPEQVQTSYTSFQNHEMADFSPVVETHTSQVVVSNETTTEAVDSFHKTGWTGYKVVDTTHGKAIHLDGDGDYVQLGRVKSLEAATHLGFAVDFARSDADQDVARLVWNQQKMGLTLTGNGLIVNVATADEGFKAFKIADLDLKDTDLHRVAVMVDTQTDHLQVLLDDKVVLDETSTDFDFSDARAAGWTLGTSWNRFFDGDVVDFRLGDRFDFLADQGA
jgi:chitodextrinase